jgi:hypothetical protein
MMSESKSEVARLRQQIDLEYESAKQGLSGLASGTALHAFITTRTENIQALHEELIELVGPDEALKILAETIWSPAERSAQ